MMFNWFKKKDKNQEQQKNTSDKNTSSRYACPICGSEPQMFREDIYTRFGCPNNHVSGRSFVCEDLALENYVEITDKMRTGFFIPSL